MFHKRNQNLDVTIELVPTRMSLINCVLITGAGLNLVREDVLNIEWLEAAKSENGLQFGGQPNPTLDIAGPVTIHLRIERPQVNVVFGVVCQLAVLVLLGTSFINKFIRGIFPEERKVMLQNSNPVPILF